MASVRMRQRKDGSVAWAVLFRMPGPTGRPVQRTETFDTEREARQLVGWIDTLGVADAMEILSDREGSSPGTRTFLDFATEHIESLSGVTEGTRRRYAQLLAGPLSPLHARPIDAITPAIIRKWVNDQAAKVSGKTIGNRHGLVSAVMKAAVRDGLVASNPCEGIRLPKSERQEMCFLTGEEFAVLLSNVRVDAQNFVALLPATGLRFSEATALQVRDVDLEQGLLTVSRAWKFTPVGRPELGAPKSSRSRRTIALPRQAREALAIQMQGKGATDLIFTNSQGGMWTAQRFYNGVWKKAVDLSESEIGKRPRVHDMRHTCASWMIRAGTPLPVIQRHLGHENISVTIDRYGHLEPAHLIAAAQSLEAQLVHALPEIEG